MEYKLKDKVPCTNNDIVYVMGVNNYLYLVAPSQDMTWKELLEKSIMNFKKRKYDSCIIIIENPLSGKVYQFGNYDRRLIYEHGRTNGYA